MSILLTTERKTIRTISGRRGACSVCREDNIQLVEIRDEVVVDAHLDPGNYTCLGSYCASAEVIEESVAGMRMPI